MPICAYVHICLSLLPPNKNRLPKTLRRGKVLAALEQIHFYCLENQFVFTAESVAVLLPASFAFLHQYPVK